MELQNELPEERQMPLWQHLDELRNGLIRSLLALTLAVFVCYYFIEPIVLALEKPLLDLLPIGRRHLYFTGIADKFFVYVQVAVLSGLFISAPYLLYEIWRFVSPGLRQSERRFAIPFVFFASLAFLSGLAFSYWIVIPYGYKFLIQFGSSTDQAMITLREYFSLTLKLMLAVGLVFETPVLLLILGKMGVIDSGFLKRNRGYAFLISAIVAAVATPSPDAFTMILVMIPLYLLYEISIFGMRWVRTPV